MSADDDLRLADAIAAQWPISAPTGYTAEDYRALLAWRTNELDGRGPRTPWDDANRGTVGERLRDVARELRLIMSAMRCPGSVSELAAEDVAVALLSIESRCTALARLSEMEEAALCFALERATFVEEADEAEAAE